MCQKCVEAVERHYPELPRSQYGDLLFAATAFPFAEPERIDQQLKELREKTDGTLEAALAYADSVTEAAMEKLRMKDAAEAESS